MEGNFRYTSLLLFLMRQTPEKYKIAHERKRRTCKIPTWKNWGLTKYPQEKIWDPRNTHEKNSGPTNYPRQKTEDPRNTHEKKLMVCELPTKARWYDGTIPTKCSTLIYREVCQKHYGKAEKYKLFWIGINRALQGVGILLIKKWVVKVMNKQGKWENDRYWGLDSKDYFFSDICLCPAIWLRL